MSIALERTKDILGWLGQHRRSGQFCTAFSGNKGYAGKIPEQNSARKNLDMIVANNLKG